MVRYKYPNLEIAQVLFMQRTPWVMIIYPDGQVKCIYSNAMGAASIITLAPTALYGFRIKQFKDTILDYDNISNLK